jgi:hypothetical protein
MADLNVHRSEVHVPDLDLVSFERRLAAFRAGPGLPARMSVAKRLPLAMAQELTH